MVVLELVTSSNPQGLLLETTTGEAVHSLVARIVRVCNQLLRLRALLACCAASTLPAARRSDALAAACAAAAVVASPEQAKRKAATSRTLVAKHIGALRECLLAGDGSAATATDAAAIDGVEDDWALLLGERWSESVPTLLDAAAPWELLFAGTPFPAAGRVSDRVKHERSKVRVVLSRVVATSDGGVTTSVGDVTGAAKAARAKPPLPPSERPAKRSRSERRREQKRTGGRVNRHAKWVNNPNAPPPPPPFDVRRLLADRVAADAAGEAAPAYVEENEEDEKKWRLSAAKLAKLRSSVSIRAALRDPQLQEIIGRIDATEPHARQAALQCAMRDTRLLKFVDELLVEAEVCPVETLETAVGERQQISFTS